MADYDGADGRGPLKPDYEDAGDRAARIAEEWDVWWERCNKKHSQAARYGAEFTGTFFLVLTVGCVIAPQGDTWYQGVAGSLLAPLAIGTMLMVMIYALGNVSGAHFNPAVTLAVLAADPGRTRSQINLQDGLIMICCQIMGGVLAGLLAYVVTGWSGVMAPVGLYTVWDVIAVEMIYTCALCYVVLNVATTQNFAPGPSMAQAPFNNQNNFFGLAIGMTVTAAAFACGGISGCCLNPAVALGIIFSAGAFHGTSAYHYFHVYLFAPLLGGLLAALFFRLVRKFDEYDSKKDAEPLGDVEQGEAEPVQPPPQKTRDVAVRGVIGRGNTMDLVHGSDVEISSSIYGKDLWCGLSWDLGDFDGDGVDVDCCCCLYGRDERLSGERKFLKPIYFGARYDEKNQIFQSKDDLAGGSDQQGALLGDNEVITFNLNKIQPNVEFLFFAAIIYDSTLESFHQIPHCQIRCVEGNVDWTTADGRDLRERSSADLDGQVQLDQARELCRFRISGAQHAQQMGSGNAMLFSCIYRRGDKWYKWAIGKCFSIHGETRSYRQLKPQFEDLVKQKVREWETDDAPQLAPQTTWN